MDAAGNSRQFPKRSLGDREIVEKLRRA